MKNCFVILQILAILSIELSVNGAESTSPYNTFKAAAKNKARKCYRLVRKVKKPNNESPIKTPSQYLEPPKYEAQQPQPKYETQQPEQPKYETPQTETPSEKPKTDSNPSPQEPVYNNAGFDVQDMLNQVNEERSDNGAEPLKLDATLMDLAQKHSVWMSKNSMSHTGEGGSQPFERCKKAGYQPATCGENVASGQKSVDSVMTSWINSPGHHSNIIDKKYNEVGFGMVNNFWTQLFGEGGDRKKTDANGTCNAIDGNCETSNPGAYQQSQPNTYGTSNPGVYQQSSNQDSQPNTYGTSNPGVYQQSPNQNFQPNTYGTSNPGVYQQSPNQDSQPNTYGTSNPGVYQQFSNQDSQPNTYSNMSPSNFGNLENFTPNYSY